MKIVVTGACGYIGSHLVVRLAELGHKIISVTNNFTENYELVKKHSYVVRMNDGQQHDMYLDQSDTLIHLGGFISVEESMSEPLKYYQGNTSETIRLLKEYKWDNVIFASTAACFDPVSHYAKSKLACEWAIKALVPNYTIFRFFNVAGINEGHYYVNPTTHIISKLAECAVNKTKFIMNGYDFDTPDKTCVRDYVDVNDLVEAIVKAINKPANTEYECLGQAIGYSNKAVLHTMESVIGKHIDFDYGPRRDGDAARLVVPEVSQYLDPQKTLRDMCKSTYGYFKNLKNQ
jgi:UDP-glucose 4-epimerase